jgi:hypothetical protein
MPGEFDKGGTRSRVQFKTTEEVGRLQESRDCVTVVSNNFMLDEVWALHSHSLSYQLK